MRGYHGLVAIEALVQRLWAVATWPGGSSLPCLDVLTTFCPVVLLYCSGCAATNIRFLSWSVSSAISFGLMLQRVPQQRRFPLRM